MDHFWQSYEDWVRIYGAERDGWYCLSIRLDYCSSWYELPPVTRQLLDDAVERCEKTEEKIYKLLTPYGGKVPPESVLTWEMWRGWWAEDVSAFMAHVYDPALERVEDPWSTRHWWITEVRRDLNQYMGPFLGIYSQKQWAELAKRVHSTE